MAHVEVSCPGSRCSIGIANDSVHYQESSVSTSDQYFLSYLGEKKEENKAGPLFHYQNHLQDFNPTNSVLYGKSTTTHTATCPKFQFTPKSLPPWHHIRSNLSVILNIIPSRRLIVNQLMPFLEDFLWIPALQTRPLKIRGFNF